MNPKRIALRQGDVTITRIHYFTKGYPIWLTIASMDKEMYQKTGKILPEREWTAETPTSQP